MSFLLSYDWAIHLLAIVVYAALAGYLIANRRGDALSLRFGLYLALLACGSLALMLSFGPWAFSEIRVAALRIFFYTQAALPMFFYVVASAFALDITASASGRTEARAWDLIFGFVLLLGLVVVDATQVSLTLAIGTISTAMILSAIRVLLWVIYSILLIFVFSREYRRTSSPLHHNRLNYLALAFPWLILDNALELALGEPAWPLVAIFQIVGSLILAYAILRHSLVDLRYLIRQSARFLLITAFTVLVYVFAFEAVMSMLRGADPSSGLAGALIAAVGLALIYQPVRDWLQRRIESALFGRRYNVQTVVQEFSQRLSERVDLDQLAAEGRGLLENVMGARDAALLIAEGEGPKAKLHLVPGHTAWPIVLHLDAMPSIMQDLISHKRVLQYDIDRLPQFADIDPDAREALQKLHCEVYVPVLSRGALIGVWVVGAKMSGDRYTDADLSLLSTLADQSAVAVENARLLADLREQVLQIRSMRDYLDSILSSIATGVLTLDSDGKIISINRAAEGIFRTPSTGVIGQHFEQVLPPMEGAQLPLLLARLWAQTAQHLVRDVVTQVPARGQVHLSIHLSAMRRGEEMVGVAMVVEDLTEQARLELERRSQEQETRHVRDTFERYVAPTVVEGLLTDPRRVALGGERQLVTVLFADIQGFTKLSEQLPPEELVHVLNGYLSMAARTILRYEGTLDKFMGDGVMAFFNAPLPQPDHAWRAACAALGLQREVTTYTQQLPEGQRLCFRVGLHTGEAVVGNIGTRELMNYTAIGDTVNISKRLEENATGGQILLSRSTHSLIADKIAVRAREKLSVRGRESPVEVFELIGAWESI